MFFFFQAEDGIRDLTVTGVQTCALPISHREPDEDERGQTELVDDAGDVVEGRDGVVRVGRITVTMTPLVEGVDVKVGLQRDAERVPRVRMSREPVQEQERRATVAAPVDD